MRAHLNDPAHLTEHQTEAAHDAAEASARLLARLRETTPLTHCITNSVVTNVTANALLALGAAPAMVDITGEAGPFAAIASALLVNLGTPNPEQRDAAREAVEAASRAGTPWVIDPVAIGALPVRTALAHELLAAWPTAIRGNASEILALAGAGAGGRGVDAADTTDAAADAARRLAADSGAVVAVSGPVDLITDGVRIARIANGDALLTRVTGGGCALGAVTAAFLGAARSGSEAAGAVDAPDTSDAFDAVVAATLVYTVAAELAAGPGIGPGTFAVRFLDALAAVDAADLRERAHVTVTAGEPAGSLA
ncbi:hydroxyethylthiazole kinase [Agromyces sp. CFH 90414]|uniref:Hydroxyethylthiazole kinase n=1 Tax=Agromyces agglutinans TaxID=2662258 RepID=A0A6I2FBW0_9MICO|nr:hydroxyethylthiazole kinase [Agromyces agglutinans]MRG59936.1 hydroxyethylthiazole kinase [Agromyces agglutinans]